MKIEVEKVANGFLLTVFVDGKIEEKFVAASEYELMTLFIGVVGYSVQQLLEDRPAFDKNYDNLNA